VISLHLGRALLSARKSFPQRSTKRYHALATRLPDTMPAGQSVVHIQPYKTTGARREFSNAQSMAQSLPTIYQVLGIHPPTYSRSTVSTPPTMTANPPVTDTTAFDLSPAPQTFDLEGALEVVRYPQMLRRTTLHTNTT
jgi:hypothetical protein